MPARLPASLPAAVLWDMDGTLIDTEPYWIQTEQAIVHSVGGRWTYEDGLELVGNDLLSSAEVLLARAPIGGTPEALVHRLLEGVIRLTREHLPWRPGARELLQDCRDHQVPCALVTMSWTALADVVVEELPRGAFTTVVTGDQIEHGKPHPEAYLEAARRLGMAPGDCVAIEDSPTGVASATAAGVPTLAVPHVVPVPPTPGAVEVGSLSGIRATDLLALARGAGHEEAGAGPETRGAQSVTSSAGEA